ncbi:STAS domain-containing protein [Virgibacillus oceani]
MRGEVKRELGLLREKINETKLEFAKEMAANFTQTETIVNSISEFVELLLDQLSETVDEKEVMERAVVYGKDIGEVAMESGSNLDESIHRISSIRRALWGTIKKIMLEAQMKLETSLEAADKFDPLFDKLIYAFSIAYCKSYKDNLERAEDEFLTLSAPIVTIMENIAILPIIGGVDEKRAGLLMDKALKEATDRDLDKLFIDLSGVTLIDTMVAYYLYKIVQSLDLVGVTTILVGIRPEVTQTMVSLGVEFSEIKTYGSLNQALLKQNLFNQ